MSDYDMSIHYNRSGKDWAKFFVDSVEKRDPRIFEIYTKESVEENMMGWFCNAMMAMHDSIHNNEIADQQKIIDKLKVCTCGEFDVEFNIHCNSCVKDKLDKTTKKLDTVTAILKDFTTTKECRETWIAEMHATILDVLEEIK